MVVHASVRSAEAAFPFPPLHAHRVRAVAGLPYRIGRDAVGLGRYGAEVGEAAADAAATTVAATTTDPNAPATKVLACSSTASGMGRMSFSAVGDNLMNENLLTLADGWAGSAGDGTYDFSPFYAEVAPVVQSQYDVSFINQETTLGGSDRYDYMGYPSYNTPDSLADAVADAGWRIVNTTSNHT